MPPALASSYRSLLKQVRSVPKHIYPFSGTAGKNCILPSPHPIEVYSNAGPEVPFSKEKVLDFFYVVANSYQEFSVRLAKNSAIERKMSASFVKNSLFGWIFS
jgi:hypothetical protein